MRLQMIGASAMANMMAAYATAARDEDPPVFRLRLKGHRFDPPTLTVPSGTPVVLIVGNADDTPVDFESSALGVDRVISAGHETAIRIGPLEPGEYPFLDEFHQEHARGVLVAAG